MENKYAMRSSEIRDRNNILIFEGDQVTRTILGKAIVGTVIWDDSRDDFFVKCRKYEYASLLPTGERDCSWIIIGSIYKGER